MSLQGYLDAVKTIKGVHDSVAPFTGKAVGYGRLVSSGRHRDAVRAREEALFEMERRLLERDALMARQSEFIVQQKVAEFQRDMLSL